METHPNATVSRRDDDLRSPTVMGRRRFLHLSALVAAAGVAGVGCGTGNSYELHELAEPELLSILGPDAVGEIGRRYREMVPDEDDVETLHAAVLAARPPNSLFRLISRTSVDDIVRDDFAEGRTVLVQGWVLSTTEARQCALYSLLHP